MALASDPCVLSTASDGTSQLWDLRTATVYSVYRENEAAPRSLSVMAPPPALAVGASPEYFLSAHKSRPAIHMWQFTKDAPIFKCAMQEPLMCTASHPAGAYVAAGGQSGKLYVWDAVSGELLRSWNAHYKAVSAVTFSPCGTLLVSGGHDGIIHGWDVGACVDTASMSDLTAAPPASVTWSDHSLPVTSLCFGPGMGLAARLYSGSADRSVRIWNVATGVCVHRVTAPSPVVKAMPDCREARLCIACTDGAVYLVDLHVSVVAARAPAAVMLDTTAAAALASAGAVGAAAAASSSSAASDATGAVAAGAAAPSLSALSALLAQTTRRDAADGEPRRAHALLGHTGAIADFALASDGETIVTGGEDGSVRVWDVSSRQQLFLYEGHKHPITSVCVLPKPRAVLGLTGRHGAASLLPVAPLRKHQLPQPVDWRGSTTGPTDVDTALTLPLHPIADADAAMLDDCVRESLASLLDACRVELAASGAAAARKPATAVAAAVSAVAAAAADDASDAATAKAAEEASALAAEVAALRAQVAKLTDDNARWKAVNNKLIGRMKEAGVTLAAS